MSKPVSVSYTSENAKIKATAFANVHNYPCLPEEQVTTPLNLNYTDEYIELCDNEKSICTSIDFIGGSLAHRQQYGGGKGQAIAKAIGIKQGKPVPTVLDATAGLARDAFVIACLGCPITMLEQSALLVELINNAIERAEQEQQFQSIIKTGFQVINTNSIEYLTRLDKQRDINTVIPDVIYIDPMYPDRKKSASVKKNMQILQALHGSEQDSEQLLEIALRTAARRVVVKRPKGADCLSSLLPTHQVNSKKTRYDVYIT